MQWQAEWIWDAGEASPRNAWRCFRRSFTLPDRKWNDARLAITADSRYVLWVNGTLVGRGPARSWPSAQMYDTYDVAHLLRRGEPNVIAALVHHYGLSTFSYLRGRGGLLAQFDLRAGGEVVGSVATDASWRVSPHLGQDPRAPRMSQQLGFAEQVDARRWDDRWIEPAFDDSGWQEATPVGPVGVAPWTSVVPRDIPPLAEETMLPARIESLTRVEPVSWTTTIDVRSQFVPGSADHANWAAHAGYLATILRVPAATRAVLGFPSALASVFGPCAVNGVRYGLDQFRGDDPQRFLDVDLRAGDNWLVFDLTAYDHGNGFHVGIDLATPFELVSPVAAGPDDSAFVSIGPFPADASWARDATWRDGRPAATLLADHERFQQAAVVSSPAELERLGDLVLPVPLCLVSAANVFASSIWVRSRQSRPVPSALQMLASPTGQPVAIPLEADADTELVVDFGRILSGYLEFEVEAPDGTVLDFYGFEFLHDGRRQDTYRVDNTLRYICRAGRQRYLSPIRRGLRYLMITVRGATDGVLLHELALHQSNYPAPQVGQFQSSDPLLNDIWEISRHTTRVCMEDTFVDCPTYEQAFWVGDSRNESLVAYYAFGAEPLVRRCLRLVPGSRDQTPYYGSQVPSGWINVIPDWTFFWVLACREHYERTGDLDFAREIWPHVRFTLDHYLERLDGSGLLAIDAWNLLDWAPMDQPNDGVVTHQNCFLVAALRAGASLAELAEDQTADRYRAAAAELSTAINRGLWSDERDAFIDAIHPDGRRSSVFSAQTQVVAFLCGVSEGERAARLEALVLNPPEDFVPIGSPFMSFFHYEALAKLGRFDTMLADMRTNYGMMLAYGATTCWEMYPNYSVLRANRTFLTRSHCHAWSAGPLYFLGAHVLGVRPLTPGWTEVAVDPAPVDLAWARGTVPLPHGGVIAVSWEADVAKRRMDLQIRAPGGVTVRANLPDGFDGSVDVTEE